MIEAGGDTFRPLEAAEKGELLQMPSIEKLHYSSAADSLNRSQEVRGQASPGHHEPHTLTTMGEPATNLRFIDGGLMRTVLIYRSPTSWEPLEEYMMSTAAVFPQ
jgi:hypothetical protein